MPLTFARYLYAITFMAQTSLGIHDKHFLSKRASRRSNVSEDARLIDGSQAPALSNETFAVGDRSSRCERVQRAYTQLPPHFMSDKAPFAEPTQVDFAHAKKMKIPMAKHDVRELKTRLWMLDIVVSLLRKHEVHFWLDAGSLLGAYRGGGFIPWDDDIDFTVPISFQPILLGPVKEAAAKHGITISQLFFPPGNSQYQPAVGYIQRNAPRVANTHAYNSTLGTQGYFVQALYQGRFKLDMWQAFPVILDGMVLYSNACAGSTLFSKPDVYPLRQCKFEGRSLPCPQRTHRYLVGIYKDIALPKDWRSWWSPYSCSWDGVKAYKMKAVRYLGEKDPNFATLTCDSTGALHMNMPDKVRGEADSLSTYRKHPLGADDAEMWQTPSGTGYAPSQLMPR